MPPPPPSPLAPTLARWSWIHSILQHVDRLSCLLCRYGFFMIMEISVCHPAQLTEIERNQSQDNIRQTVSTEGGGGSFQAAESGRMIWICHTGCSNVYPVCVFFRSAASTLAPCGSLLNLMIYAQTHAGAHMERLVTACAPDRLSNFHGNSGFPTARLSRSLCTVNHSPRMIIVILAVTDFQTHL